MGNEQDLEQKRQWLKFGKALAENDKFMEALLSCKPIPPIPNISKFDRVELTYLANEQAMLEMTDAMKADPQVWSDATTLWANLGAQIAGDIERMGAKLVELDFPDPRKDHSNWRIIALMVGADPDGMMDDIFEHAIAYQAKRTMLTVEQAAPAALDVPAVNGTQAARSSQASTACKRIEHLRQQFMAVGDDTKLLHGAMTEGGLILVPLIESGTLPGNEVTQGYIDAVRKPATPFWNNSLAEFSYRTLFQTYATIFSDWQRLVLHTVSSCDGVTIQTTRTEDAKYQAHQYASFCAELVEYLEQQGIEHPRKNVDSITATRILGGVLGDCIKCGNPLGQGIRGFRCDACTRTSEKLIGLQLAMHRNDLDDIDEWPNIRAKLKQNFGFGRTTEQLIEDLIDYVMMVKNLDEPAALNIPLAEVANMLDSKPATAGQLEADVPPSLEKHVTTQADSEQLLNAIREFAKLSLKHESNEQKLLNTMIDGVLVIEDLKAMFFGFDVTASKKFSALWNTVSNKLKAATQIAIVKNGVNYLKFESEPNRNLTGT